MALRTAALVLAFAAGCSREAPQFPAAGPPVTGRVVVKGAAAGARSPLAGHRVRFETDADPALVGVATVRPDGAFEAATIKGGAASTGLPPGEYRVWVERPGDKEADGIVAARYRSPKTSGLKLTVPPSGEVVFELDPPGR